MSTRPTLIERAYQLARSGECATLQNIKRRLKAEGFVSIEAQLFGPRLQDELRRACQTSLGLPATQRGRRRSAARGAAQQVGAPEAQRG